jgi:hypothetical protein
MCMVLLPDRILFYLSYFLFIQSLIKLSPFFFTTLFNQCFLSLQLPTSYFTPQIMIKNVLSLSFVI